MHNKLAIVIPAYKSTFLRQTLESIAAQTDKRFTLYIGDDCSPSDLKSIVDEYTDRIHIIYHRFEENLGGRDLVAHWERCISLTINEPYIWLFSDDDTMDSNCVKSFYALTEDIKKNSLIHFNVRIIDDLEKKVIQKIPSFKDRMSAGEFLEAKLCGNIISYVVEFIFSRDLYNKVGGFQNFDLAWGSDFMTWLKIASEAKYGIISISSNDGYVNWRKSGENISPNNTRSILIRKINSLIENAVFLKNELKSNPTKFSPIEYSFRWVRFPLGELWRNKNNLSILDIIKLIITYIYRIY